MGILDLFKPKKKQIVLHKAELKNCCKDRSTLYDGKICNISPYINDDTLEEHFSLYTYENFKVGNFKKEDYDYCEDYDYAILRNVHDNQISAYIICENVFPRALKSTLNNAVENGTVVSILQDGKILDFQTKNTIGTITDYRLSEINVSDIAFAQVDGNKIVTFFYKKYNN